MKQLGKKVLVVGTLGVLLFSNAIRALNTTMTVPLTAGIITISAPASFSFQGVSVSFANQTVTQDFTGVANYFTVSDMKGHNGGYSTTLQLSGSLSTTGNSIAASNVAFMSDGANPVLLSGSANPRVLIDNNANSYQGLDSARTFIYRDSGLNTGTLSMYYQTISMQVTVPASQPAGNYAGTLIYTIIEN